MSRHGNGSNAEVLDVLFAVALGEGFLAGMFQYKADIVSGAVFSIGEAGQGFYRVLLGFLIVILSWLHFRSTTLTARSYPTGEFVADILVAVSYMTLFLFVDAPTAYYTTLAVIWLLYTIARFEAYPGHWPYFCFNAAFVGLFAASAATVALSVSAQAEWLRLLAVTTLVIAYRPIDALFLRRRHAHSD